MRNRDRKGSHEKKKRHKLEHDIVLFFIYILAIITPFPKSNISNTFVFRVCTLMY